MTTLRQRMPRVENEPHRRFVASLPCLICGARDVQAAHIRYSDSSVGKPSTGMGQKPDDKYSVPLCVSDHADQHAYGSERYWWKEKYIDPIKVSLALFAVSGDVVQGELIVSSCREQRAA